jgi:hypothetical protein
MLNKNRSLSLLLLLSCAAPALCEQKRPVSEAPDEKVNFPSNFQVEGGCNLLITGEYLYWTAREDGLYFAQNGFANPAPSFPPSDSSISFDGKLKKIHPGWDSGLRLGAGLNFPREGYDAIVYWTWFASNSRTSAHGSLLPVWAEPDFIPFAGATHADARFNLNLNVLDVEWGRSSWFGGYFSLRPFFGLRGAWIDQTLKTRSFYSTTPPVFGDLHSCADFRGGGLRAGLDTRFTFPYGLSIYGLASGSLLCGQANGSLRIHENTIEIAHTKDRFCKGLSSVQMALGFGWDTHFAKDRLHIELHVGWESNIWFGINQMNHYLNQLNQGAFFKENGNLSTQGLVAGGRFDF